MTLTFDPICFDRRIYIYLFICIRVTRITQSIKPNRMKFGGMIGYYPGTIWFDFGIRGQGREKVNIFFLP